MATYRKQKNQSLSKVLLLVSCLLLSNITKAYDFKVDDIYYNKISETEVEVTYNYLSPITPIAYTGDVVIPSVVTYSGEIYKVTGIGEQAFYNCGDRVKSVTMPSSILKIGQGAFSSLWNLTYIEIPKSVVAIGDKAFSGCHNLVTIDVPENVVSIGNEAFDYCLKLEQVTLHNSLRTIGKSAFEDCGQLKSINIPNSVETIGDHAFNQCSELTSIVVPNSVKEIGRGAFNGCTNLKSVSLSQSISIISDALFFGCKSLESIIIPNTVKIIGELSFSRCYNLISIQNSTSLESIGRLAFEECYRLSSMSFPKTLQSIGSQAFWNCPSMESVFSEIIDPFQLESQFFYVQPGLGIPTKSKTLTIPSGTKQKYVDKKWTKHFSSIVELTTQYNLSISSIGNGTVSCKGTNVRNNTSLFSIDEGLSVTIAFTPDDGYRIKSVKVNNSTVSVSNNQCTISIGANTTVSVEFEAITPTTYTLSVTASGNGSATYGSTAIRNNTRSFTVNEGTSATVTFSPDDGYRIKTVKVNNSTVSVSNNQYTINSISANTTVSVEFEAIPPTTYTLSVTASGNGSATYGSTAIRNNTRSFTVNEGTSATITFTPDDGYRIKAVKVNNSTVSVSKNQYTINCISANTTVSVEFEAIPITTYTLSVTASGNGSAIYSSTTIRNNTRSFTVNEGTSATITFSPDDGYRIKAVKVNNSTVSVSNNQYTISSISANTTISVEFEAIPPTTYTLSVTASGNGSATYSSTTIRNNTRSFTVNEGTSATITFSPDDGYRIKTVKVNNSSVSVSNNQYTISSINANTTVSVEFEAIPITTYTLSVTASGNGSAIYSSTTIRNNTRSFTVNGGTSATITFSPDDGYRIKSVKVNNSTVTVSINRYTISSVNANTTVNVEFEAIPPTTYTLSITASGNGSATYGSMAIRNNTRSFTVNEGTSATITFSPDDGYRIKSVKVNGSAASVSNNRYPIIGINANTTVEVEFEAIPIKTYTLFITANGNGMATYNSTPIRNNAMDFTVNEGTSATIIFTPNEGYRIKTVKVNNYTVSVSNNQYTISSISANTTVIVEFEAIPPTTYTLSVTASGNGSATYGSTAIRNNTRNFTVNEGASATITFIPDDGYRIKSVKVNNYTVSVSNNQYTINSINANTTVSVEFEAIPAVTYSLSITASGNGFVTYNTSTICNDSRGYILNEGTSVSVSFTPDEGYQVKSVRVNGSTVSAPTNSYYISSITKNTTIEVEFEAIPIKTFTLMITANGNGSATYGGTTIRRGSQDFTLNEGTSATITFTPDDGYRIKTVKVNNSTVSVSNNQYTINSITTTTAVEVEFEAIPPTTYTLSITASGNGSATYGSTAIRNNTRSFTVNEGESATITFSPNSGYRIKTVKVNGSTVSVSNNSYTISNITRNTTVEVEFEAIPPVTYSLSITASGNGSVSYNTSTIRNDSRGYVLNEGTSVSISITPDEGYQVKSFKVNGSTVSVPTNSYYISGITRNSTIEVEFEAIPIKTFTLSITANGNGSATYGGTSIRNGTRSFTVNEGTSVTITFSPDEGYRVKGVNVNGQSVTVTGNQYTIDNISSDVKIEVVFEMIPVSSLTVDGVRYSVVSNKERTVNVAEGDYGLVLTVPETIEANGLKWKVTGIEDTALNSSPELAAIVWNLDYGFTGNVSNPNLLLYVKSADYAPTAIKNVVVNGVAESIILTDAESGNNFYCPQEFTARSISYDHHYGMTTGIGEARGWETLALPFDVQKVTHTTKGDMTPFATWKSGDAAKPFWLMELSGNGFVEDDAIKANTPYIVSMPNNDLYKSEFRMAGTVKFSANNVTVKASDNLTTASYADRMLTPNFVEKPAGAGCYALNVSNELEKNNSGMTEGSRFVLNIRQVHPFEAYMTSTSGARYIGLFDDDTTDILRLDNLTISQSGNLYDLQGRKVSGDVRKGVYIKKGKKLIIK